MGHRNFLQRLWLHLHLDLDLEGVDVDRPLALAAIALERDTDLKKLGAIQRRFDDKELELHDHLDLSTACRFHLHLGLAQVAIGKDGKQHLDEAKKLADELADHDLIWLCDKHTRARASLEC